MEAYKVIGILRIKDQNGEWQEIQAIKGDQGNDGYTPQKGIDYFDGEDYILTEEDKKEIAGLIEGEIIEPDLSGYATTDYVDETISANKYKIGQGLFHNLDNNVIGVRTRGAIVIDNGYVALNTNNLFTKDNSYFVISGSINVVPSGEMVVFNRPPKQTVEDTETWLANVTANATPIFLGITAGGYGLGGTIKPVIEQGTTAINGETYDYVINMSGILGPNIQASTGMTEVYVCYRGGNFTVIIVRDTSISLGAITYLDFGIRDINYSLAHHWIGNRNQFRTYNNNGTLYLELNENYINNMIDNKLSGIAMAEEVSV